MPRVLNILGFKITHNIHSIYDFISDYEPTQNLENPPVVTINHVSFLDVFYLYTRKFSFLAKTSVGKSSFFGAFAVARQCIFVNRSSNKDKNNVLFRINKRINENVENGNFPIIVFPEGTISNGYSIIKFKRGAFMHDKPIKVLTMLAHAVPSF